MDKRYQVFISSTFLDLREERQAVSQALLRSDCFPAQMDDIPLATIDSFEFTKTIIDQSDYFILISAARYGSINPATGLSYSEMEYNYALNIGMPILGFFKKNAFRTLDVPLVEETQIGRDLVRRFQNKVAETSLVGHYGNIQDLVDQLTGALQRVQKHQPVSGWVKSNSDQSSDTNLLADAFRPGKSGHMELENVRSSLQEYEYRIQKKIEAMASRLEAVHSLVSDVGRDAMQKEHIDPKEDTLPNNKVFIVHGHDETEKSKIQYFLLKIGLDPIVLHEQPNRGATIIEKFEKNAKVGFAVVLMTPDDQVLDETSEPKARARQNVLLELGYFVAKLGRENVCVLTKGDVEIPSDIFGVIYIKLDEHEAWKLLLLREIKEAGHAVNMDALL